MLMEIKKELSWKFKLFVVHYAKGKERGIVVSDSNN